MLNIKVVGGGCPNCQKLAAICNEVISEQNFKGNIEKITNINEFADLGVFKTPGLVVNDEVLSQGRIPDKATIENWLREALNK